MRKLPVGMSNFKEAREGDYAIVDKSLFIQALLDDPAKAICITRPRRFCKTSNLDMAYRFFSLEQASENRTLFNGMVIEGATTDQGKLCMSFQGQFPTIFVTFKGIRADSFESAIEDIKNCMSELYEKYAYLVESDFLMPQNKRAFQKILEKNVDIFELKRALVLLTHYLERHHKKRVMILLDEYDTPFHEAYSSKVPYHEDLINFMKVFLGETFKDNGSLEKSVITGILRVSLMDLFSGANNVMVYSMLLSEYAPYFGLTESEVVELVSERELTVALSDIRSWYNGYEVGGVTLYNPWSIIACLHHKGQLAPYWNNSGHAGLLGAALKKAPAEVKDDFLKLFQGESVWTYVDEGTVFADFAHNKDALLGAFLFSGYLKVVDSKLVDGEWCYEVKIPNEEILLAYKKMVREWTATDTFSRDAYDRLFNVIAQGDIDGFKKQVQNYLDVSASYNDLGPKTLENVYHMLVFGMLFVLRDRYTVGSNLEAGKGRPDIYLIPKDRSKPGIIFEFKRTEKETSLEEEVKKGLKQINEGRYRVRLESAGISSALHVGMAFCGREIAIGSEMHTYTPQAPAMPAGMLTATAATLFQAATFDRAASDLQAAIPNNVPAIESMAMEEEGEPVAKYRKTEPNL